MKPFSASRMRREEFWGCHVGYLSGEYTFQTKPLAEQLGGSSVSILGILSTFGIPKWGGRRFGRPGVVAEMAGAG